MKCYDTSKHRVQLNLTDPAVSTSAVGVDLAIDFIRITYRFRIIGFNKRFSVSHSLWVVYHDTVKNKSHEL
jgi:hypothetical protein